MSTIEVAILGAGGKVGSNLLSQLAANPRLRVRGICRNEITAGPLRLAGHTVDCGDVTKAADRERLLGRADVVVNCAAASGPPGRARKQDEAVLESLAQLSGSKRIVHFSSVAVYGSCVDASRNTFEDPRPDDPYGRDKLHLERVLQQRLKRTKHQGIIVRLGHVYGERQWVSRYVFTLLESDLRLPLDGRLPSNAVHVKNVGAAIESLALGWGSAGVYNLVDRPQSTWREIFDWNTRAAGLPPIGAMDDQTSRRLLEEQRKLAATPLPLRAAAEAAVWARAVPHSLISSCPSIKAAGAIVLATLKLDAFEQLTSMTYSTAFAQSAKARVKTPEIPKLGKLLSDGVPGPVVQYTPARSEEDARLVGTWYARYSDPDSVLEAAARLPALAPERDSFVESEPLRA